MRVSSQDVLMRPAERVGGVSRHWLIRCCLAALAAVSPGIGGVWIQAAVPSGVPAEAAAESPPGQPDDIPLKWLRREAPDANGNAWYRFTFQHGEAGSRSILTLAAQGRCSISVNGQRILKGQRLEADDTGVTAVGIDITRLIREGRNSVAVELAAEQPEVVCAFRLASLAENGQVTETAGEWKAAAALPPAGWQRTDFNDRDWSTAEALSEAPETGFAVRLPETVAASVVPARAERVPFSFVDGDHVVLLGATFFEREQQFGHLEACLSAAAGGSRVTFRNLGWDADTVFADSRGIFDSPAQGYLRLIEHVRAEEPTVIIVCYGQNEVLSGGWSPEAFTGQYGRMLDDIATTGAVVLLMSPHGLLPAVRPVPSPSRYNRRLGAVTDTIRSLAEDRGLSFVDLFDQFAHRLIQADQLLHPLRTSRDLVPDPELHPDLWAAAAARWTANGMHLNDRGYEALSLILRQDLLSVPAGLPLVSIDPESQAVLAEGAEIRQIEWRQRDGELVRFDIRERVLSSLSIGVEFPDPSTVQCREGSVQTRDQLTPLIAVADGAAVPGSSSRLLIPPDSQYSELVRTVIRKNGLYFHRWRPQNITYLFGFRKHEQGNNAAEIVQFDPLIAEHETRIHQLQQPGWRTVRLMTSRDQP